MRINNGPEKNLLRVYSKQTMTMIGELPTDKQDRVYS